MSGFVPVSINQFVRQYLHNTNTADGDAVRAGIEDAIAAWRQGVRCACGKPLWVAGSAVAGYGCYSCITGSPEPDGDPEIDQVCPDLFFAPDESADRFSRAGGIQDRHMRPCRDELGTVGCDWRDDEHDILFEEEAREERQAVPETDRQRWLVRFLDAGGPVNRQVLDAYLEERYAEKPNLPLIRKYFKAANPHLKAILLAGLDSNPTDPDLLDDLAYFSEFDSILGDVIRFYTDACVRETDMERFSLLAQDFHMNTVEQGFDALYELIALFPSGTKGAVVQHLSETIDDYDDAGEVPF